jgi:putative ABC transport system permease protein
MYFYLTAILQGLCFSGLALGIYLSMKIFNIPDITTDGSYTLGGIVTAVLLTHQMSVLLIIPVVMLSGALAGAVTGLIHTKLKVNALLAGILTMTTLYSVNLVIAGRSNIPLLNISSVFNLLRISTNTNLNTLVILLIFVFVFAVGLSYLLKTDFGLAMRATGSSESMIKALGVSTDRMKVIGLALANALTALSGYLTVQFQNFADINMGIGIVIIGLGSVIIAETVINFLRITFIGISLVLIIMGAVLFRLALAFTLSLGIDANLIKMVTAGLVLLFVGLPQLKVSNRHD